MGITMMIVSHLMKAERDNSLFNKSTTPQVHSTITTQIIIRARISNDKDIQVSPTIHTNYNLKSSFQFLQDFKKRSDCVAAKSMG